jgi:hypothetical protein
MMTPKLYFPRFQPVRPLIVLFILLFQLSHPTISSGEETHDHRVWRPLEIGLFGPGLQLFSPDTDIYGLRLNVWGASRTVLGLDLGLFNTADDFRGIQIGGILNRVQKNSYPLQMGLLNAADGGTIIQLGALGNKAGHSRFMQLGIVNLADETSQFLQVGLANDSQSHRGLQVAFGNIGTIYGLQAGLVNNVVNLMQTTGDQVSGVQIGALNGAIDVKGIQLGIFNSCENIKGIQIGILNVHKNGFFKYMPGVNF